MRDTQAPVRRGIGGLAGQRGPALTTPAPRGTDGGAPAPRGRFPGRWTRTAAATIAFGVAGCASSSRPVEPTVAAESAAPIAEVDPARPETRVLQLRFRRPFVNGRPGHDFALIRFLEESLSPDGHLEYRREDNSVIVTDYRRNLHAIETVVHLLDFSGLPMPPDLGHLPFRVEEEVRIVPNLPPR